MNSPLGLSNVTKTFGRHTALKGLSLEIPAGRVVGLIGRNGSGKTTLFNLACGLQLPTQGTCTTLGRLSPDLDAPELSRLGVVFQVGRFLEWMTVGQQLAFHASFYPTWDKTRENHLLTELELDPSRRIAALSTGDQQKLGIILGVCHHPSLLLLDEPVSSLDPIVRGRMLSFLLELAAEDKATVVVSSHILTDIEKLVDWIVCLDGGELAASMALDELQETYAEWLVTSASGSLPVRFSEPWVLSRDGDHRQARLQVRIPDAHALPCFEASYSATVTQRPLNLDQVFPILIREREAAA